MVSQPKTIHIWQNTFISGSKHGTTFTEELIKDLILMQFNPFRNQCQQNDSRKIVIQNYLSSTKYQNKLLI